MDSLNFKSVDGEFSLSLSLNLWEELRQLCQRAGLLETGGILVGHYNYELSCAVITQIIGPTVDSKGGKSWFFRGVKGLQLILNNLWQSRQEYYLGEWHFHPFASPTPSQQDVKQMQQIAKTAAYNCPEPLLLIVGGNPNDNTVLSTYIIRSEGKPIELVQL